MGLFDFGYKRRLWFSLQDSYGRRPDPFYAAGDMSTIRSYHDYMREQEPDVFHIDDVTPYTDLIDQWKHTADFSQRQAVLDELQDVLAQQRPFIPLWFGRTLHVQSPTIDGIDYPSSSFSNENVWAWTVAEK